MSEDKPSTGATESGTSSSDSTDTKTKSDTGDKGDAKTKSKAQTGYVRGERQKFNNEAYRKGWDKAFTGGRKIRRPVSRGR